MQILKNKSFLILSLFLLNSFCSSQQNAKPTDNKSECQNELMTYLDINIEKFDQNTKNALVKTAAITAGAGVAITETTVYFGGGIAVGTILCSPLIAMNATSKDQRAMTNSANCVVAVSDFVLRNSTLDYTLTKKTYSTLESMHRINYNELSRSIRGVANCYYEKGTVEDIKYAHLQMNEINSNSKVWKYLSETERNKVILLEKEIGNSN